MKLLFITNDHFDLIYSRVPFRNYLNLQKNTSCTTLLISKNVNSDHLTFSKNIDGVIKLIKYIKNENYNILIVRGVELSIILSPLLFYFSRLKKIIYITGLGRLWGIKASIKNLWFRFSYKIYINLLQSIGVKFWVQNDDDLVELGIEKTGSLVNGSGIKLPVNLSKRKVNSRILYAGRISYEKGFNELIKLANALPRNWDLVVCGDLDPRISKSDIKIFRKLIDSRKII